MYDPVLLKVWLAFQVCGLVGLPILIATLWISGLRRLKTLHNLFLTWIFSALVSSLLFFAHRAMPSDPPPGYILCLLQAAMMEGVPILTALSAFSLIYDSWLVINGRSLSPRDPAIVRRTLVLLSLPWIGWFVVATTALFVGAFHGRDLGRGRRFFYCSYRNSVLASTVGAATGLIILVTAMLTIALLYKLYKYWKEAKDRGDNPSAVEDAMASSQMILRIGTFSLHLFIDLALSFISIAEPGSPTPDLVLGIMPITVFIIFSTQQDILLAWAAGFRWMFNCALRRNRQSKTPTPEASPLTPRNNRGPRSDGDKIKMRVLQPNSYSVWQDKYLNQKMPPASMWVREDELVEDDFEGFLSRHKSILKGKPLPSLPPAFPGPV